MRGVQGLQADMPRRAPNQRLGHDFTLGRLHDDPVAAADRCLRRDDDDVAVADTLREADEEMLINSLSMLCPFEVEEKQALLEAPTLSTRRETLAALMQFAIASGGDDGAVQ